MMMKMITYKTRIDMNSERCRRLPIQGKNLLEYLRKTTEMSKWSVEREVTEFVPGVLSMRTNILVHSDYFIKYLTQII